MRVVKYSCIVCSFAQPFLLLPFASSRDRRENPLKSCYQFTPATLPAASCVSRGHQSCHCCKHINDPSQLLLPITSQVLTVFLVSCCVFDTRNCAKAEAVVSELLPAADCFVPASTFRRMTSLTSASVPSCRVARRAM